MTIEKTLNKVLSTLKDEDLQLTANELGLKSTFQLDNQVLSVQLDAGFPCEPLKTSLLPRLRQALAQACPDYQINLDIHSSIKSHRTQLAGKSLRGVKNTIAIASGKGGVGKSTVTVNLAIALAKAGARVGILDADIYGPSIPLMLGKCPEVEVDGNHYLPVMAHGIQAMSIGFLTDSEQALIWRGPMLAKSLIQMLDLTRWDNLDYLLIDLPPGTGDIQLSLVQKIPLTAAIVVTTPQNVATLDAQKALKMFARTQIDVLGIVENMATHRCSQCGHQDSIFGTGGGEKLSENFNTPLLGQLPLEHRIQSDCDKGQPSALDSSSESGKLFLTTALKAAVALAQKPLNYADKFPDIVLN